MLLIAGHPRAARSNITGAVSGIKPLLGLIEPDHKGNRVPHAARQRECPSPVDESTSPTPIAPRRTSALPPSPHASWVEGGPAAAPAALSARPRSTTGWRSPRAESVKITLSHGRGAAARFRRRPYIRASARSNQWPDSIATLGRYHWRGCRGRGRFDQQHPCLSDQDARVMDSPSLPADSIRTWPSQTKRFSASKR